MHTNPTLSRFAPCSPAPAVRDLRRRVGALLLALAMLLGAGCSSGEEEPEGSGGEPVEQDADQGGPLELAKECPATIVLQTDWDPESEYGTYYQLIGDDYTIDTDAKTVTGSLVASGTDTGVDLEIRVGGPAIGFQAVPDQMYQDTSIHLGQVNTDEIVAFAGAERPMLAVVAPLEISPFMLMWSPDVHPEWNTVVDIGQTDRPVLYFEGEIYMDYLVGSGILREGQVDGSFDGSPGRFVAAGGDMAVQNFATDAPFSWVEEVEEWDGPLEFQMIHETGYPFYSHALGIRSTDKGELAPCLAKLVPIIQQAQVDFMTDPVGANELIVELVEAYQTGWVYTPEHAAWTVQEMRTLGIVSNGPDDTVGNFDMDRIQTIKEIVTPILRGQGEPVVDDLAPEDVATNEFIDPDIGLPVG